MNNTTIIWIRLTARMSLFAVALLWPAGNWLWPEAWAIIIIWSLFGVLLTSYLMRHDPALLTERLKLLPIRKGQKTWDRVIMLLFVAAAIGLYIVPGFDVIRYQWSEPIPVWIRIFALALHLPCFILLAWVFRENKYLAQTVKIDKQRGHKVITTGPYSFVRHPMYSIVIVLFTAHPVALGSNYALILSAVLTVLLIVRTYFEDRMLHAELEGYTDYAQKTRYRLLPHIW